VKDIHAAARRRGSGGGRGYVTLITTEEQFAFARISVPPSRLNGKRESDGRDGRAVKSGNADINVE